MKAYIRKIYMKNVVAKNGTKFDKVVIECDCVDENSRVKTRVAEMSKEYAIKYFNYCGVSSAEAIGKQCEVTLQRRMFEDKNGEMRTFESIKYLNLLNDEGERIIMAKDETKQDLPF